MQVQQTERPRVGVACFLTKNEKYYLQRRKGNHGNGDWSIPGGHLEYREPIRVGVVREVKEETGVDLNSSDLEFRGVVNSVFEDHGLHYVTIFFEVKLLPVQVPIIREPHRVSNSMWLPIGCRPESQIFLPLKQYFEGDFEFL